MKLTGIKFTAIALTAALLLFNCNASRTVKGGAIGAGTGAVIGGIIGNQFDNTAVGAIIGAAVGGTAGALIGRHMDKQAEELRNDLKGAEVERVGEGIRITFNSGIQFAVNSYELSQTSKGNLQSLASTLNKYDDTDVLIEGHTDSSGSDDYNLELSNKRANSVLRYLVSNAVVPGRLTSVGYGEAQPIADNATKEGMAKNRRVEVAIYANEKMKKAAKRGEL
jgi:outer membrane protein OmpA-like peptidoglycan-associated protein